MGEILLSVFGIKGKKNSNISTSRRFPTLLFCMKKSNSKKTGAARTFWQFKEGCQCFSWQIVALWKPKLIKSGKFYTLLLVPSNACRHLSKTRFFPWSSLHRKYENSLHKFTKSIQNRMEPLHPWKNITQASWIAIADWLLKWAQTCRDLPASSNFSPSKHIGVQKMPWQISLSTRNNYNARPRHQFLSNRERMQIQSETKENVGCRNNDYWQYLCKSNHFQTLIPLKLKDYVMNQTLFHLFWASSCRSMQFKKCLPLKRIRQKTKSNSNVKSEQFVGTGEVDLVAVQSVNENQSVKTYAYLDDIKRTWSEPRQIM